MSSFEWDDRKAQENAEKHGVSFETVRSVFGDPNALTYFDTVHSENEDRFVTLGFALDGILLVVVHADRGDSTRLISARPATRREQQAYADGNR